MSPHDRYPDHAELLAQQAFLRRLSRRLSRRLVADEHRAADLAQDSALAALERAPEAIVSMRAWLGRVARSLASNSARDEDVRSERERQAAERATPRTPEDVVQQIELQREVLSALAALEEPYKSTLFLRYWEDLPPSAIAARTDVPVSTVKTRLSRGLERMRSRLDARHRGERSAWAVTLAGSLEGLSRPTVGGMAAAGGRAMGMKVAFATAAGAGALALGTWWILHAGEGPFPREASELAVGPPVATPAGTAGDHGPRIDRTEAAPAAVETERAPVTRESEAPPAWQLELVLEGFEEAEDGLLSITVGAPAPDGRQLEFERNLSGRIQLDVGELFAPADRRPEHLTVRLDHPWHLPCDTAVLVPRQLRESSATSGLLQRSVRLKRARAVVAGTVMLEDESARKRTWVMLYAMEAGRPVRKSLEYVNPGPDGTFRLRANEASEHVVAAYVRPASFGKPANVRPESRVIELADGAVTTLDPITLREDEVIEGRVTFPGEFEPYGGRVHLTLADAPLCSWPDFAWIGGRFELRRAFADWDDEGRFRIAGLAPQRYELVPLLARKDKVPTVLSLGPDHVHHVVASALGVQVPIGLSRIAFRVTSAGAPAAHAEFSLRMREGGIFTWESHWTDERGRLVVVLDPSHGLDCEVDDRVHQRKKLHFTPAELERATEIEITLSDEPVRGTATLAIRLTGRARELGEELAIDVRFFDRSHAEAMSLLEGAVFQSWGSRPTAQIMHSNRSVARVVEDDAHVFSELPTSSYIVRLTPRLRDADDAPCLLLPTEFSVDLAPGERVERVWTPELGGGLRFNITGGAAWSGSLHDAAGERVRLGYRVGTAHSSNPAIPGVSELNGALPEGIYELRLPMKDGTERAVPVQVRAGRVSDVVLDVDAL